MPFFSKRQQKGVFHMAYFHGARTTKKASSVSSPNVAESGIVVVIGTTPLHAAADAKGIALLQSWEDAKKYCGFSYDWSKYTACEQIYAHFQVFKVAPLIVINPLDITSHKESKAYAPLTISDGTIKLPYEAIATSVKIKATEESTATLKEGVDYELAYEGDDYITGDNDELVYTPGALIITATADGALKDAETAYVTYELVKPADVSQTNVVDAISKIDLVFPKYHIIPDIATAPKWSKTPLVATLLAAKMETVSTIFKRGVAYADIDTSAVTTYSEAPAYKNRNNLTANNLYLLWLLSKIDNLTFHTSTLAAALTAATDAETGNPSESPSNLSIKATSTVLADGTEVNLQLAEANYLNQNGIATVLSFTEGLNLWGNELACYPAETDPSEYMLPVSRMFGWVGNTVLLTHWKKVDRKQNRRLIDNVVDTTNIWLNGLTPDTLLAGRVETISAENPQTDVIAGKTTYHIFLAPCSPNREMDFILEYDADGAAAALSL